MYRRALVQANQPAEARFAAEFSIMASRRAAAQSDRLRKVRDEFWPDADPWTGGEHDDGWFKAPRTLPLVFNLIRDKRVRAAVAEHNDGAGSGRCSKPPKDGDPTCVYLELLSRQFGDGIVEIQNQAEHAYAAGYTSTRGATRTWQDHMRTLESLGFIKIQGVGPNQFKYILMVHPVTAIHELDQKGHVPKDWMAVYRDRRIVTKELSYEDRQAARQRAKFKPIEKAG